MVGVPQEVVTTIITLCYEYEWTAKIRQVNSELMLIFATDFIARTREMIPKRLVTSVYYGEYMCEYQMHLPHVRVLTRVLAPGNSVIL